MTLCSLVRQGVVQVIGARTAIRLPSKLLMRYEDLKGEQGEQGTEYTYQPHVEVGHGSTAAR